MEQSSNEKIRKPGGENSSSSQTGLQSTPHRIIRQQAWQHIILLIVLGYEGAGALLGGILLIAAPDGRLMDMPVNILHGVFIDFLIPGFILSGMGILTTLAFIAVLSRTRTDWLLSGLALGGLVIWFVVEIIILQEFHWLHAMWGLPVLVGCLVAIPLISLRMASRRSSNGHLQLKATVQK